MTASERICSSCGKAHSSDELELVFFRPEAIVALPKDQRAAEVKETDDLCSIRMERFFVRTVLPLPVTDWGSNYNLGVWAEVSEEVFFRIRELWSDQEQDMEPAFDAVLANTIPHLAATCGLPVHLQLTGPKTRPEIRVPPSSHPLHQEQCQGITAHRAAQYTESPRVRV